MNNLQTFPIQISAGNVTLRGDLSVPGRSLRGMVLFAHGSGSSRHSPRNQHVAEILQNAGMATLLLDLLTDEEETTDLRTGKLRFDIDLLAERLLYAAAWLRGQPRLEEVKLGYFGASTGAAAALVAVAEQEADASAVVSRGGRPDLAGPSLEKVKAPTLLIVGSEDRSVLELNRQALAQLSCEKKLEIIAGATHLFEEPGTLDEAAKLAEQWFELHLRPQGEKSHAA